MNSSNKSNINNSNNDNNDNDNNNNNNSITPINLQTIKTKDIINVSGENKFKLKKELLESEELERNKEYDFLYPTHNDPNFNVKISNKKEFSDYKYDGEIHDIISYSDKLADMPFELAPQQVFVRNFMSFNTPYNSLLLYHGLGSGKTCTAITVAEEMRRYLNQMNISQRILIIASPNVQDNFKLQLFNENKLVLKNGFWSCNSCTGNNFLKEINPMNSKDLTKEYITQQIKKIINSSYLFLGYIEFANYINKKVMSNSIKYIFYRLYIYYCQQFIQ